MAESRVTSTAAEILSIPVSQARIIAVAAEVLATASSEARVSAIALVALVSVAAAGVTKSSQNGTIVMVLGA